MRTLRQEQQVRDRLEREHAVKHRKALLAEGWVEATSLPVPDGAEDYYDFYTAEGKKIGRALYQRNGSYACSGVGDGGLVPPGTITKL
jgi:hypothetical protein